VAAAEPEPEPVERRPRADLLAKLLLALVAVLLVDGARRVGPTYDEHFYVASGYAYWRTGDFGLNREHPPLAKLLCALPLLALDDVEWSGHGTDLLSYPVAFFFQRNGEHVRRNLFLARLPVVALALACAWGVYRTARRRVSPAAGVVALAAFGLSPNVLAHGSLAALDCVLTALCFLAVVAFVDALERPAPGRTARAGVAFGLANLAKFTALVLGPVFLALAVMAAARARSPRPLVTWLATVLAGLGVFAAGYGFEARSVAEVWSRSSYAVSPSGDAPVACTPADLAAELAGRGVEPGARAAVAAAEDTAGAVERVVALADASPDPDRVLGALARLAGAPGADRERAFAALLARPGEPGDERRAALAACAGVRLGDRAAWTAWYEANRQLDWDRRVFTQPWIRALTRGLFGDERPIPLLTAFKGIDYQLEHASRGHGTYFRGRSLRAGVDFAEGNPHPEYYLTVLGVKNPLAFLALVALGLACSLRAAPGDRWTPLARAAFVGVPLVLVVVFSRGNALLGVKYVLPVFPFLALWAARAYGRFPRLAGALALIAVLESVWIHPDELMYYNAAAGGPSGGPEITVVGDDWGQGVPAVGRFYARHRDAIEAAGGLYYEPYSRADAATFGLERARRVEGRPRGIVAVHATNYYRERARYAWLDAYEPFLRLARSVWVYDTRGEPPGGAPDGR